MLNKPDQTKPNPKQKTNQTKQNPILIKQTKTNPILYTKQIKPNTRPNQTQS